MRSRFKTILRESRKEGDGGLDDLWARFQQDYGDRPMTRYLKKNWFSEQEEQRWQLPYREVWQTMLTGQCCQMEHTTRTLSLNFSLFSFEQGFPEINTNNLLESWHKTLKKHYLRNERNVRPDYLIWMLTTVVDVDARVEYHNITNGFQAPRMSEFDKKKRRKRAYDLSIEQIVEMVTTNGQHVRKIQNFFYCQGILALSLSLSVRTNWFIEH